MGLRVNTSFQLRSPASTSCPALIDRELKFKQKAVSTMKRKRLMLGADPEFEIVVRRPTSYEEEEGDVICAQSLIRDGNCHAEIGVDGSGDPMELRPKPASTPKAFVKNVGKLIRKFHKKYPNHKLSVEGETYALGGHIHFGVRRYYEPSAALLAMFDIAIGEEATDKSGGARAGSYGDLSDYSTNAHGFEYRTCSATIFAKPRYLEVVTKLLQGILRDYLKHPCKVDRLFLGEKNYSDDDGGEHNETNVADDLCGNYTISSEFERHVKCLKDKILGRKDKRILREFSNFELSNESIFKYWKGIK